MLSEKEKKRNIQFHHSFESVRDPLSFTQRPGDTLASVIYYQLPEVCFKVSKVAYE